MGNQGGLTGFNLFVKTPWLHDHCYDHTTFEIVGMVFSVNKHLEVIVK